jgi:hypothetical protein
MYFYSFLFRSRLLLGLVVVVSFYACEESVLPEVSLDIDPDKRLAITDFIVPDAEAVVINEESGTIEVTFPCGSDLSAVTPNLQLAEDNTASPASGATINLNTPVEYTLVNGNLFSVWTVTAKVRCITGFLSHHNSRGEITDDDEKAAADWFFANYDPDLAKFVSFQDIKDGTVDLSAYKVLWWYHDRNDIFGLPAISQDSDVLNAVGSWYQAGGNLYLSGYANQYLWDLGRITANYNRVIGAGPGFENGDTWTINVNINRTHDMSSHPIFAGLPLTGVDGRKEFPIIDAGWREDHNYVIVEIPGYMVNVEGVPVDPNVGFNENEMAYERFIADNDAVWLGTWGGINDYFMAGILELKPNAQFQGTAVFQGIGGIEYNQNEEGSVDPAGQNAHQANIDRLTRNTISYLSNR